MFLPYPNYHQLSTKTSDCEKLNDHVVLFSSLTLFLHSSHPLFLILEIVVCYHRMLYILLKQDTHFFFYVDSGVLFYVLQKLFLRHLTCVWHQVTFSSVVQETLKTVFV